MTAFERSNNKRILRNSVLLYFRMLLMLAIGLFTSRVVLKTLGVEDFGLYNVVGGFVSLFTVLRSGVSSATQRFMTFDLGKEDFIELKRTFSACFVVYLIISILILVLAESFGIWFLNNKLTVGVSREHAAYIVFQLSLITLILGMLSTPYNALIIAHEKMGAFAYISIYEAVAKLVVAYLIGNSSWDRLVLYATLLCVIQVSVQFIYVLYCRMNFKESRLSITFDWKKIKQIYSFTGWAMIGGISAIGFTQGLNVLLNIFFSPVVNAARGIAVQIQQVACNFVSSFQTAVNPQIIKSYAKNDLSYMNKLIFASSKFSYVLLLVISLPVMLDTEYILSLWLISVPENTELFFRLIVITSFIDALSNPFMRAVDATGNIRNYQLIVGGILLAIVPCSYVVLKLGAPAYSVFVVHIILCLIAFVVRLFLSQRLVGIPLKKYMYDVIYKLFLITIVSVSVSLYATCLIENELLRFLVLCIISSTSICISTFFIGLSRSEKDIVISKIQSILKRCTAK